MPADIRSFFTPRGSQASSSQSKPKGASSATPKKASARRRRVVDSDDDDDEPPKKPTPKKKQAAKQAPEVVKEEPTTSSSFFASSGKNKINRTAASKPAKRKVVQPAPKEAKPLDDDDKDMAADDIFVDDFKKRDDDYEEEPADEEMADPSDDEEEEVKPKKSAKPGRKRKGRVVEDESEEEPPKKKPAKAKSAPAAKSPAKKPRAPAKKKEQPEESEEIRKILDSVPTVRPPTPPAGDGETKKFNYRAYAQRPGPAAQGSKELPEGAESCLSGLTFVFTGVLESLSREDGQQLVKRYGGKVTSAPSKKTSYVVLGSDAGPKKLDTIRANKIKTIDEEGLFHLIRTLPAHGGDGAAAKANEAKKAAEEQKARDMATQMEKESKAKGQDPTTREKAQLWTVKYHPTQMNQICGNKGQVEKLQRWLKNWPKNRKINFVKRGEDGSGGYRAAMIHGPPGIGKTTAAHLVARLEGYDVLEYNASDTRSKKLMEETLKGVLDNSSLMGYFAPDEEKVVAAKKKLVLIMDEVDGMSAGDRGGVGQLASVCKKTNVPIICICNERKLPKMRPFDTVTMDMAFRRPDANAIRSRIMSIAFKEGLKLPPNVIDQLVEGTHADIRQIINMLSTYKTTESAMNFDQGKQLAKAWEKHIVFKPWDIAQRLLGSQMFGPTSNKTLNDKIELYFNDHEFSYLMLQENYLKTAPARASNYQGKEKKLKLLELADNAAQSISDGDLADSMIHGTQQQWSLMPVHGMLSTVIPASYMYGGYGGQQMSFTTWLGMNSKQGKLSRFVKEIQSHIRLRTSGDRHEIRQQYIPAFFSQLVRRLEIEGKDALPDIIETMDNYFLTKDDWDAIVELGVGPSSEETVKIPAQTKSAFTRTYNQMSHPMPFMKASSVAVPKASKKEVPDIEDAIIESDDEGSADPDAAKKLEDEEEDLSKDKYVRQSKKKAAPKKKGTENGESKPAAKGKAKATKAAASKNTAKGKAKK